MSQFRIPERYSGGRHEFFSDTVVSDLAERFGLGAKATPLVQELLRYITGQPGGVSGFLERLKAGGVAGLVSSWLGRADAPPVPPESVGPALGEAVIGDLSRTLGLDTGLVTAAVGWVLPKLIGLLTPGGKVPATVPAFAAAFLNEPALGGAPEVQAHRKLDHAAAPSQAPRRASWVLPVPILIVIAAAAGYRFRGRPGEAPPPAPAASQSQPAPGLPANVATVPPPPAATAIRSAGRCAAGGAACDAARRAARGTAWVAVDAAARHAHRACSGSQSRRSGAC